MLRFHEKALIAVVLSLLVGLLVWAVALADNPPSPVLSRRPVQGTSYSYVVGGLQRTVDNANATHVYYDVAEVKYSLHNTRLQACSFCHKITVFDPGGGFPPIVMEVTGMNRYGSALVDALSALATPAAVTYGNDRVDVVTHTVIYSAFATIENLDSDADGLTSGSELWSLTFPGGIDTGGLVVSDTFEVAPSRNMLLVHGGYDGTPSTCARCHRTHTAAAPYLLAVRQSLLCLSCHDGSGAGTNVEDGLIQGDGPLRGGGFVNSLMNTSFGTDTSSRPATSRHEFDDMPAGMWGWSGTGAEPYGKTNVTLECGNCHDPHMPTWTPDGGATTYTQYRMLQGNPRESGIGENRQAGNVFLVVPDENSRDYSQPYTPTLPVSAPKRPVTAYQVTDRIGEFCVLCHTRYMAATIVADDNDPQGSAIGSNPRAGDPIFTYQHATKEATNSTGGSSHQVLSFSRPRCLDCHVAHGTSAAMGNYSSAVPFPDGNTVSGDARSSLLRMDHRGVCQDCHNK